MLDPQGKHPGTASGATKPLSYAAGSRKLIRMSQHFSWQSAVLDSEVESSTKLVLLAIGSFMNQHGTGAFPSLETLAAKTSLSKLTVRRHVQFAEESGWLAVKKRYTRNGDKDSNLYSIRYPSEVGSSFTHVGSPVTHGGFTSNPQVGSPVTHNTPVLTPQVTPHKEEVSDPSFDQFWKQYPNKVAKANALKAWNKIKPDSSLLAKILESLEVAKSSDGWKKDGGKFIPHPATWLNGKRWEDEVGGAAPDEEILDPRAKAPPSWFKLPPGAKWTPGKGVTW